MSKEAKNPTKSEIIEKYWASYIVWCANFPDSTKEQLFWLDHNHPTEANFWEWIVKIRKGIE